MIGGTVVIVGFLTLAAGGTIAVQGYSSLGNIGIEALTGFLAAFINVRISAPVVAGIGLAATFGAGVTAQPARCGSTRKWTPWRLWAFRRSNTWCRPDRCRDDRHHAAVLDRCDPLVRGLTVRDGGVVRPVRRSLRPLLQHLPEPHRPALVVPSGLVDGHHHPVDTTYFWFFAAGGPSVWAPLWATPCVPR